MSINRPTSPRAPAGGLESKARTNRRTKSWSTALRTRPESIARTNRQTESWSTALRTRLESKARWSPALRTRLENKSRWSTALRTPLESKARTNRQAKSWSRTALGTRMIRHCHHPNGDAARLSLGSSIHRNTTSLILMYFNTNGSACNSLYRESHVGGLITYVPILTTCNFTLREYFLRLYHPPLYRGLPYRYYTIDDS
jgi:hypothetical protein